MPDQSSEPKNVHEIVWDEVRPHPGRASSAITAPKSNAMSLAVVVGGGICYFFLQAFLRQLARRAGESSANFLAERLQPPSRIRPLRAEPRIRGVFVYQWTAWVRSPSGRDER